MWFRPGTGGVVLGLTFDIEGLDLERVLQLRATNHITLLTDEPEKLDELELIGIFDKVLPRSAGKADTKLPDGGVRLRGLETEAWARPGTRWTPVDDARVFQSPGAPWSHYGHRVELKGPDIKRGLALWKKHNGDLGVEKAHLAFETEEVEKHDDWHAVSVLRTRRLAPPSLPRDYHFAPVRWDKVRALRAEVFGEGRDEYQSWLLRAHRKEVRSRRGRFEGVWLGESLIAMGAIYWRSRAARYQEIGVHPDHRRKGICSGLVAHLARDLDRELVISAEQGSPAEIVYQALGFRHCSTMYDRTWPAP